MNEIALILAAGKGTRMNSDTIKVLHPVLGKPMLQWSIDGARAAGLAPWIVVGHQEERVRAAVQGQDVRFVRQAEARGTGHAVLCALDKLPATGTLLVFFGDTPLFRAETLRKLLQFHGENFATFLTSKVEEAASYGRLIRDDQGRAQKIVEAAEATAEELAVQEINTGASVFDIAWLKSVLPSFQPHLPKNEIYLTDALEAAYQQGKASAMVLQDNQEAEGVNDRWDLTMACKALQKRILKKHAKNGVSFEDPSSITVESDVQIERDVWIGRGCIIKGATTIAQRAKIEAYCILEDTDIAEEARIREYSHCFQARVERGAVIGPYGRLREQSIIGPNAKIGNFVEVKKTTVEEGAKANHLTYLGDATVGAKANVGAGTITCNYDGFNKSRTEIGQGAFIGSNSALVAPVRIGEGAIVGAGAVITKDVPKDALSIARGEQRNIQQAAIRFRVARSKE